MTKMTLDIPAILQHARIAASCAYAEDVPMLCANIEALVVAYEHLYHKIDTEEAMRDDADNRAEKAEARVKELEGDPQCVLALRMRKP